MKIQKWFDPVLYSNIFISVCAAAMAWQTFFLIHADVNWLFIAFVFSATLALYNFPVFIPENFSAERSERHQWVRTNKKLLVILFLIASAAAGLLSLSFPFKFILWFAPAALLALAYFFPQTQLRGIVLLKTLVVAFVWTCTTALMPLLLISDFQFSEISRTVLLENFLFIFPLCLIFNVRDIEGDRQAGVQTIPIIYGVKFTIGVCLAFFVLFSALSFFSSQLHEFRIGLLISAVVSAGLILFASEKRSDYYYSLWVDGMILLQTIVIFLLHIF